MAVTPGAGGPPPKLKLDGFGQMTLAEVKSVISAGGRIAVFPYAESWLIVTFKRASKPTLVKPGASTFSVAGTPILMSLLFGWWGFPWGPIYTIQTLWRTLHGGINVTDEVMANLEVMFKDRSLTPIVGS